MNKREDSFPEPMPEYRVPRVAAQQSREREQAKYDKQHPQIFDEPTPDPTEFAPEPDWRAIAAKRYPRSAKLGRIKGTGSYVLECPKWLVLCFRTFDEMVAREYEIERRAFANNRSAGVKRARLTA
jgi:hypothetical protein